ncbi:ABC transporter ATP-binding protein [soil metagenome]
MIQTDQLLIDCRGIGKRFGPTIANDDVDFSVRTGEIHALLGENGAGKTTLLSILCGLYQPDSGSIAMGDESVRFRAPIDSIRHGIGTVHQHFTLAGSLTVLENIALGLDAGLRLNLEHVRERSQLALQTFGLLDRIDDEVRMLTLGERQRVEIVKALVRGSKLLLLDEPTSILSPDEIEDFFAALRNLADQGVGIVIVTHKLDEALAISDRITVLRRGRVTGTLDRTEIEALAEGEATARILALMFANAAPTAIDRNLSDRPSRTLLRIEHVSALNDRGGITLQDVSFDLRGGELTGIAGVDGNGQRELAEVIGGQRDIEGGHLFFLDAEVSKLGVGSRRRRGLRYLTDDRLGEGSVADLSLAENLALTALGDGVRLDRRAMHSEAERQMELFDIRAPTPDARMGDLSGGNIQKALLARELAQNPKVLVASKPTHGLDTRTAVVVRERLRAHADAGNAVLLIESDLDALLGLCDCIVVLAHGRVAGIFERGAIEAGEISRLMVSAA